MRIVVTGGAGYIGSHAARALALQGYEVAIYDNLCSGHRAFTDGFEFIEGEIGNAAAVSSALRGADAVMHFAAHALVGESVVNPRKYFQNNLRDGLVLLNACIEQRINKFIFSSTCAVYGVPEKIPIREDFPTRPVNPYGCSKLAFEYLLQSYGPAYGLGFMSLRYFNAAGADASGEIGELHEPETHLLPNVFRAAAGGRELDVFGDDYPTHDGTCVRDYIHVTDLATAHVAALHHLEKGGDPAVLNLGTGQGHSVRQVIATVESVTGRSVAQKIVARRSGDPPVLVADPSRAESLLGWKARLSLRQMVESGWNYFLRHSGTAAAQG